MNKPKTIVKYFCYTCGKEIVDKNKSTHSPHFCSKCDGERIDRIDKSLEELMKGFKNE